MAKKNLTTEEKLERLTGIVTTLATSVTAHDSIIGGLAVSVEAHDRQIDGLLKLADRNQKAMADLDRRWQAYLNTLRRQ